MSGTIQVQKQGVIDFLSMIYNGHPEYSLFAVKAPIDEVVQAWMELREGLSKRDRCDYQTMKYKEYRVKNRQMQWEKNILLKFVKPFRELNEQEQDEYYKQEREELKPGYPFIQVKTNGWVVVICSLGRLGEEEVPKAAKKLSAKLKTKAITLIEEDTSGAIGYDLFENGELSEKFQQAPDFDFTFESKIRAKPDIKFDYDDEDDELLVDAGCNVNTRQLGKDTPLTAACRIARIENVQALISAGANVNKVGMHDMAPLVTVFLSPRMNTALAGHGLAEKENNIVYKITQIVQALIEAGADLNVYEVNGKTALMLAVEQSYFDIVKMLIIGGANINVLMQPNEQSIFVRGRNIVCKTALHLAVEAENIQAIKMLLEASANVNIPDSEGKIPLDIAIEKNLTEIAVLISYK